MPDDPDVSMKEALSRKFLGGSRIRIFLWGDPRGAEKRPIGDFTINNIGHKFRLKWTQDLDFSMES